MSELRIVTGSAVDGYTIHDQVLRSLQCIRCGKEHPTSVECDPKQKAAWQTYWVKKCHAMMTSYKGALCEAVECIRGKCPYCPDDPL